LIRWLSNNRFGEITFRLLHLAQSLNSICGHGQQAENDHDDKFRGEQTIAVPIQPLRHRSSRIAEDDGDHGQDGHCKDRSSRNDQLKQQTGFGAWTSHDIDLKPWEETTVSL
jgi:hypothetical protein